MRPAYITTISRIVLALLIICTSLVAGVSAGAPSSADDGIASEQYWQQLRQGISEDHSTYALPLHPLLQWNSVRHQVHNPVWSGADTAGILTVDPSASLSSPGDPLALDTLNPEFVRTLSSGFIPNRGQFDSAVEYVLQYQGTTVFFTRDGLLLTHTSGDAENWTMDVIRQTFGGASPGVAIIGQGEREGRVNYYMGDDPSAWLTEIRVYGEILYRDLYPGIDLVYFEENGRLKREFRVAPGASPDAIEILYDNDITPSVDDAGILRFASPAGEMLESPLLCWQVIEGEIVSRIAEYLITEGSVRIAVDGYDPGYELIIDPELVYSTFLAWDNHVLAFALAPDGAGGIWVAGGTQFFSPVTEGAYQGNSSGKDHNIFVSRFSPTGALVSSSYMGGRGENYAYALAPDGEGGVWVTGYTDFWGDGPSWDFEMYSTFPVTADAYQSSLILGSDAFLSRFSPKGALLYSTYLWGGSGRALASDGAGGVWVAGSTTSANIPVSTDAYQGSIGGGGDAFLSRFSSTGSLLYLTYLGGGGEDSPSALSPDGEGGVWVAGSTVSDDFPGTLDAYQGGIGGGRDAFLSHFSSTGALLYSTYLGASGDDRGDALAPDGSGGVWVAGYTRSADLAVTEDAYQGSLDGEANAFLSRFSSAGSLLYSTYLGGSGWDLASALAPDGSGGVWVAGSTVSDDFPVTLDAYQGGIGGDRDAFLSRFSSAGAFLYSTYLGGSGWDSASALAPDGEGGVWVAGEAGMGQTSFPVTADAIWGYNYGKDFASPFLSRFSAGTQLPLTNFTATPTTGEAPLTVQFTDTSTNTPTSWIWEYSTGDTWTQFSTMEHPSYQFTSAGTYSIRLTAANADGSDTLTKPDYITVNPPQPAGLSIPLTIIAGIKEQILTFGTDQSGTDGYDTGLDLAAPPLAPGVAFDAVFMIANSLFPRLYTDIRGEIDDATTERTWQMHIISKDEDAILSWDPTLLPEGMSCTLTYAGTRYDMTSVATLTIPQAGDGTVQKVDMTLSSEKELTIPLAAGWNLVSVPYANTRYSLPSPNPIQVIYAYNPTIQTYVVREIEQMQPGKAYWVASTDATEIMVVGTDASPLVTPLTGGWNLIGGTDQAVPFASIVIDPTGAWAVPFVYGYNTGTGAYEQATVLVPGHGYWGAVTVDSTITIPGV